jgi:hypothetical protein
MVGVPDCPDPCKTAGTLGSADGTSEGASLGATTAALNGEGYNEGVIDGTSLDPTLFVADGGRLGISDNPGPSPITDKLGWVDGVNEGESLGPVSAFKNDDGCVEGVVEGTSLELRWVIVDGEMVGVPDCPDPCEITGKLGSIEGANEGASLGVATAALDCEGRNEGVVDGMSLLSLREGDRLGKSDLTDAFEIVAELDWIEGVNEGESL